MKPNKHILPLLSVIASFVAPAMAQEQAPPPPGPNGQQLGEIIGKVVTDDNLRQLLNHENFEKLMKNKNLQKILGEMQNIEVVPMNEDSSAPPNCPGNTCPPMHKLLLQHAQNRQGNGEANPNQDTQLRAPKNEQRGAGHAKAWRIGLACVPVDDMLREHLDLPKDTGVIVTKILEGSPAAKAGIKENDIVISANQQQIGDLQSLADAVQKAGHEGKPLALNTLHKGQSRSVSVQPEGPPRRMNPGQAPASRPMPGVMMKQAQQIQELHNAIMKQQRAIDQLSKQVRKLLDKNAANDAPPAVNP